MEEVTPFDRADSFFLAIGLCMKTFFIKQVIHATP